MKKFILLVSAWLGFATTATVHAQVESTPYAFTNTAREEAGNGNTKGNLTKITLPTRFTMEGWTGLVIYDDPEGFVLNEDTKMLYADWSEFTNDAARMSISYTAVYKDAGGTEQTISKDLECWVNVWMHADSYDLTTFGSDEGGIDWVLKQDPDAKITIRTIKINNFAWNGGVEDAPALVVEYGLETLNIAGEDVTELPAKQENAKFYGGEFTVVNSGQHACNFSWGGLEIPEQYQGGYVRIDFGAEPANVWSLNLAFSDAEGQGVDGGWTDINGYVKKIGLSRYYKIPEGAVKTNPQIWKSSTDGQPWTVNVAGLYLTNGFDNSSVYTDEFFPLEADKMNLKIWGENAFDDATKQQTLIEGGAAGWQYSSAQDFSSYEYAVVVMNEPTHDDLQLRFCNENNYGSATEGAQIGAGNLYASFDLDQLQKKVNEELVAFDPSQVYISCFWAAGWGQGKTTHSLSHVFLTNTLPNWENPDVRTTKANNYGTVCFEYPTVVSGAYIYTVEGKDAEGTTLYLKPYNGVLTAGVPYIYRSINEEGVNFYQMESEEAKSETPVTRNGLVGCLNATTVSEGGYALHTDNAWYKIDAHVTFTNRAYLNLDAVPVLADEEAAAANVNRMVLGDWETTGIDEVKASPAQVDDEAVYNLSGIKMDADNLPKGIYIRGGKKFIVK